MREHAEERAKSLERTGSSGSGERPKASLLLEPPGQLLVITGARELGRRVEEALLPFAWRILVRASLQGLDMLEPTRLEAAVLALPLPGPEPSLAEIGAVLADVNPCCALAAIASDWDLDHVELPAGVQPFWWPLAAETLHLQLAVAVRAARRSGHVLASGEIRLHAPSGGLLGSSREQPLSGQSLLLLQRLLRAGEQGVILCGPEALLGLRMSEEACSRALHRLRRIISAAYGREEAQRIRFCAGRAILVRPREG
jgi:hypothetical protein